MKFTNIKLLLLSLFITVTYVSYGQTATLDLIPKPTVSGTTYTYDLTATINQTNSNKDSVSKHRIDIQSLQAFDNTQKTINNSLQTQINNIPTGGGSSSTWKTKNTLGATTYTISAADSNYLIICNNSGTAGTKVVIPTNLPNNFNCKVIQDGGQVTFSGTFRSKFKYTKIQTNWGEVTISTAGLLTYLYGDLK